MSINYRAGVMWEILKLDYADKKKITEEILKCRKFFMYLGIIKLDDLHLELLKTVYESYNIEN